MQPEDATIVESWWRERWLTTSDSQYRGAIVRGLVLKTVQHELEEDKPAKGHKARKTVRRLPNRFVWSWGATFKSDLKWLCLDVPRPTLEHSRLLCACQGRQVPLILKQTHHLPQLNAVELLHPFLTGEQVGRKSPEEGPWPVAPEVFGCSAVSPSFDAGSHVHLPPDRSPPKNQVLRKNQVCSNLCRCKRLDEKRLFLHAW